MWSKALKISLNKSRLIKDNQTIQMYPSRTKNTMMMIMVMRYLFKVGVKVYNEVEVNKVIIGVVAFNRVLKVANSILINKHLIKADRVVDSLNIREQFQQLHNRISTSTHNSNNTTKKSTTKRTTMVKSVINHSITTKKNTIMKSQEIINNQEK